MKPFSLESVLAYRIQLEKIAKNRLYAAEKSRREAAVRLQERQALFQGLITDLAKRQSEGIDVTEMIRYDERIVVVKDEVASLQNTLSQKDEEVVRERENTLERSRERKVMEKLKEKQNAAWQRYLNKKEAAMMDEIAVIFHER